LEENLGRHRRMCALPVLCVWMARGGRKERGVCPEPVPWRG